MGMRIKRAMGWGMRWDEFTELTKLDTDQLHEVFERQTAESLTVPREYCSATFQERGVSAIISPHLLSETFVDHRQTPDKIGSPEGLFETVGYDRKSAVIFFPNLNYRATWFRRNDDLDYAFEQWREGIRKNHEEAFDEVVDPKMQGDPREFIVWPRYGFYPFTNFLMLEDGTPQAWDYYEIVEKHPEWLPAIPSEIIWYMDHLGILKKPEVFRLRPVLAQWWS